MSDGEPGPASGAGLGVALGAGGARGLAHVVLLEALDDLGLRPAAITGTSMGAVIGGAYAAGLSGRELRSHLLRVFGRRHRVMALLLEARVGRFTAVLRGGLGNPVMVDAELVLSAFWPAGMPERFEDLAIPFAAVATDFYARDEIVIGSGALRSAVAGSMAIPGLVRPVVREGRTLVDGAATNPLPYDRLPPSIGPIVACDVVAGPVSGDGDGPTAFPGHVRLRADHAGRHHGQDAARTEPGPPGAAARERLQGAGFLRLLPHSLRRRGRAGCRQARAGEASGPAPNRSAMSRARVSRVPGSSAPSTRAGR